MICPPLLRIIAIFAFFLDWAHAGTATEGHSCSAANDHLDPTTGRFLTECTDKDFCSAFVNGTCTYRKCRRDEYPFGYAQGETVPPLCPHGSFCPDEGSGCRPLVAFDQSCQLNRDEQCAPPPNWAELANESNFNGSLCLQWKCLYADATLARPCQIENTTYIDTSLAGAQLTTVITRDTCRTPELFCDAITMTCERTKDIGGQCRTDGECKTRSCSANGSCINTPETPLKVAPWQYGIIIFCIAAVMIVHWIVLTLFNRRRCRQKSLDMRDYYNEQTGLRRSIISWHEAATYHFEKEGGK